MNFKTPKFLLFLIVLVAAFLRLWQIGNVPPSPNWDEVSLGYNAYSILLTGRDEYGSFLPVVLRSFDDYKPALYAYLTIPSVFLFGLNTFATRLPSAIFGIISVIAVYYLVKELFTNSKIKNLKLKNIPLAISHELLALLTALLLAISPWAIQFSRVAYEANIGVTFNILTALFFLKSFKKAYFLISSAACGALAVYSYQSEKAFVPLLILALILIYRKEFLSISKKYIAVSFFVGTVLILPMFFYIYNNNAALLRVTGTSIFSYKSEYLPTYTKRLQEDKGKGDLIGVVLENRRIVYTKKIVAGYLSHFDPNWLFVNSDIQRHHAPSMGNLYLFEFPIILLGIYFLIFSKIDKKIKLFIFAWALLVPIPSSITVQVPHSVRTLNFLPIWQILAAFGALAFISSISNIKYKIFNIHIKYLILTVSFLFIIFNFLFYINMYFMQLNYSYGYEWQYGWKQAVDYVKDNGQKYEKIVITDDEPLEKSYMFFLFYLKYPPERYQKIGTLASGGFEAHHYFDKYAFRRINWEKDSQLTNTLFIGKPKEIPKDKRIKTIYNLDGSPAIVFANK